MRKMSLIRFADAPWANCSTAHNGVRKRTLTARIRPDSLEAYANKPVKLHSKVPLAMRMLIPTYVEFVTLPHRLTQD